MQGGFTRLAQSAQRQSHGCQHRQTAIVVVQLAPPEGTQLRRVEPLRLDVTLGRQRRPFFIPGFAISSLLKFAYGLSDFAV